jgi:hypothetical protein
MMHVDFVGIKVGDVNESALQLLPGGGSETHKASEVLVYVEDVSISAGRTHTFDLELSKGQISGMQFTLEWDPAELEIIGVEGPDSEGSVEWNPNRVGQGMLPISWLVDDVNGSNDGTQVVSLTVRARRDIRLRDALSIGSGITAPEALTRQGLTDKIALSFSEADEYRGGLVVYQNIPNPFNKTTTIPYKVSQAGPVDLFIYDAMGRLLLHRSAQALAGHNDFVVNADDLDYTGLLLYSLHTQSMQQTKRMIIADE